ncbi:hypothetical protein, partial [Dickeya dadantii]|uniref:hypothetical protein n=1 Tax=Dickeya dadantii TaxID=204038 RepID=UPI001EE63EA7
AAQFSHQPVVKERWRLNLSLSCVRCNGRETTPFIPHETIHLPEKIHRSKTTWLFVNSLSRPKAAIARMDNCC